MPYRERRECASRKGASFLSNVIETTIKYERTTMNAPNNPELFASSIPRPENEGALRRALSLEGREDMIKLYGGGTSCSPRPPSLCSRAIDHLTIRPRSVNFN